MSSNSSSLAAISAAGLLFLLAPSCASTPQVEAGDKAGMYAIFPLTADLSRLSPSERQMIPLLIQAAEHMDAVFWKEAWGDRDELMARLADSGVRRFAGINYGPWDRLDGDAPFVDGVGAKPAGARFYPADMTKEEFEAHVAAHPEARAAFESLYTVIQRDAAGGLVAVPYSTAFAAETEAAAALLEQAATQAEDAGLRQ
jgi:hypothetical protein